MYNQIESGTCMPLLMGYTQPVKIQEDNEEPVVYDHVRQIAVIHPFVMRTVGTYSLKTSNTKVGKVGGKLDSKNAIDDSKSV